MAQCAPDTEKNEQDLIRSLRFGAKGALLGSQATSFRCAEGPQEVMKFVTPPLTRDVPDNLESMKVTESWAPCKPDMLPCMDKTV